MAVVESAGLSDVGKKRSQNQDAFLLDDDLGLYLIADGMGGHRAGDVASRLVVETIHDFMKQVGSGLPQGELPAENPDLSQAANHLLAGIQVANKGVYQTALGNKDYRGMGSTLSALYLLNDIISVANVGDSPIYLLHRGKIELLSVADTVLEEHRALNPGVEPDLAPQYKHMLTRAMGVAETVSPHVFEVPYFRGDTFVISSDGLSNWVTSTEIQDVAESHKPQKACRILVDMANERGGDDNITVLILHIRERSREKGFMGFFNRIFRR